MLALFIAFILLCGLTHLTEAIVFYWAPYRFYTLIYVICAAVSLPTALLLPFVVRFLLGFASPKTTAKLIKELLDSNTQKDIGLEVIRQLVEHERTKHRRLEVKINQIELRFEQKEWLMDRKEDLNQMRKQLAELREIHKS